MVQQLGQLVGDTETRARALTCCRDMHCAFAPRRMPEAPVEMMGVTGAQVGMLLQKRDEGRDLDAFERGMLTAFNEWRVSRAGVIAENTARLRGAFWAVRALYRLLEQDPADHECARFVPELETMLRGLWRVYDMPASTMDQHEYARVVALQRAGEMFASQERPEAVMQGELGV
jgi:hypothetical protein